MPGSQAAASHAGSAASSSSGAVFKALLQRRDGMNGRQGEHRKEARMHLAVHLHLLSLEVAAPGM